MSELLTAARPYAKALFDVASSENLSEWMPTMEVCEVLGEQDDTKRFLDAEHFDADQIIAMLKNLFEQAGVKTVPAKFDDFLRVLSKNKRFVLLPDIATLFIKTVNQSNETVVAQIISAKPLSSDSEAKLLAKLEKKYAKKVDATVTLDESLIGGAIIKMGDTVIDGSVKGRLEQLAKALN